MIHAIYILIQYLCITCMNAMAVGNIYIPNTTTLNNINGKNAGSYFGNMATSSSNQTNAIAEQTADKQDFEFYYGLSPYLHMVFPITQFLRSVAGHIADFMYGVDVFLNTLYIGLFKIMDIRSSFAQGSPFEALLVDGQMLGIVATILAVIIYFGMMILAPQDSTLQRFKTLFQNLIVAFAVIGIFPVISNGFVYGLQGEANSLLGSDLGDSMDSLTDQLFQQNVISIPYKLQSLGLNPDGTQIQTGSSSSSSSSSSNSSNSGVFIPVTANGPVHYRQKSYFYMPHNTPSYEEPGNSNNNNASQTEDTTPIPAQELSINLSDMKDKGEQNSWNGLQETSVPSFLREYEHISSVIDPNQAKENNSASNSAQAQLDKHENQLAEQDDKRYDKLKLERDDATGKGGFEKFYLTHVEPHIRHEEEAENDSYGENHTNPEFHEAGRGRLSVRPDHHYNHHSYAEYTITPFQMINELTIKAHAATKKKSSKKSSKKPSVATLKKAYHKKTKQDNKASSMSDSSSNDQGLGIFGYQLDGKDDQASVNQIKENWKSKLFGAPLVQYYDEYKVNWFNIYSGLIMLFVAFVAFSAKVIGAFFKIIVMYTTTTIFIYKSVSAPKAWKEFLRSFFGIYEALALDVLTIRLYFESFMYINRFLGNFISKMNMPGDNALVLGLIEFCADFYMLTIAIGGVSEIDRLMGPGANSGAHHGWAEAMTGLMAMRGIGSSLGRHAWRGAKAGVSAPFKGARDALGKKGSMFGPRGKLSRFARRNAHNNKHRVPNSSSKYPSNQKYIPNAGYDKSKNPTKAVTPAEYRAAKDAGINQNPSHFINPNYRGENGSDKPITGKHFAGQASSNSTPQQRAEDFKHKKAQAKKQAQQHRIQQQHANNRKHNLHNTNGGNKAKAHQAMQHRKHEARMNPSDTRMNRYHGEQGHQTNNNDATTPNDNPQSDNIPQSDNEKTTNNDTGNNVDYPTTDDGDFDARKAYHEADSPQQYQAMKDAYNADRAAEDSSDDTDNTEDGTGTVGSNVSAYSNDADDPRYQPTHGTLNEAEAYGDNNGMAAEAQEYGQPDKKYSDGDTAANYVPGEHGVEVFQPRNNNGHKGTPPKQNGKHRTQYRNHIHRHVHNHNVRDGQTSNNASTVNPHHIRTIHLNQNQNQNTNSQQTVNGNNGGTVGSNPLQTRVVDRNINQDINHNNHVTQNGNSPASQNGQSRTVVNNHINRNIHNTNHMHVVQTSAGNNSTGSNPTSEIHNYVNATHTSDETLNSQLNQTANEVSQNLGYDATPNGPTQDNTLNKQINHISQQESHNLGYGSNPIYNSFSPNSNANNSTGDTGLTDGLFRGITGGDNVPPTSDSSLNNALNKVAKDTYNSLGYGSSGSDSPDFTKHLH